jgi:cytochrome o ubiquinol oxidase subunit I
MQISQRLDQRILSFPCRFGLAFRPPLCTVCSSLIFAADAHAADVGFLHPRGPIGLIPGLLFGMLAGYHFWFPKAFGFRLNERWGMASALCWIFGFMFAFFPHYALGLLGFPRRTVAFYNPVYVPYLAIAEFGPLVILMALACLVIQLVVSVIQREENRVPAGDPWNASALEWSVAAPTPEYNFPVLPEVTARDAFMVAKQHGTAYLPPERFTDIEMPKNSPLGMVLCVTGSLAAFGLVWHIWWMVAVAMLATIGAMIWHGSIRDHERIIPAEEIRQDYMRWLKLVADSHPVSRDHEIEHDNAGLADRHATMEAAE